MEIKKAIIPAAGLGTRFLPYTKSIPKEMLPLVNKPAIQLVIEECMAAALTDVVLITNNQKSIITDHFDGNSPVHQRARERNKTWNGLADLEHLINSLDLKTLHQVEPLGLGHAVLLARHAVQEDYFSICLPDDIIFSATPGIKQLIEVAREEKASVIAVQEVPLEQTSSYGVIGIKNQIHSSLFEVSHLVEKPQPKDAPSQLAIVGRYVLSSRIFTELESMGSYAHEELQLTPAIGRLAHHKERILALKVQGIRYDIGTPIGWLKAILGMAWHDPVYGPHLHHELALLQNGSMFKQFFTPQDS